MRILKRPSTRPGRWSVGLGATFLALFFINAFVFMPLALDTSPSRILHILYGILMLICGLAAGIVGLIAVVWKRERSWLVWLAILLGLLVLFIILFEILVPH